MYVYYWNFTTATRWPRKRVKQLILVYKVKKILTTFDEELSLSFKFLYSDVFHVKVPMMEVYESIKP